MVTWNYAASNRLLVDGGVLYGHFVYDNAVTQRFPGAIRINELNTGFIYAGNNFGCCNAGDGHGIRQNNLNQRAAVSDVAGSHAFKSGSRGSKASTTTTRTSRRRSGMPSAAGSQYLNAVVDADHLG